MKLQRLLWRNTLTVAIQEREARWTLGRRGAIRDFGAVALPPGLVADGVVTDPAAAGRALQGAGVRGNAFTQVIIALPAQRSVPRSIEVPALVGARFDEMVEREIRRLLPMLADNAYVHWARGEERDGHVTVPVIAVARDVLDSHIAAAQAAGLRPYAADLRVIAAARAVGSADAIVAVVEHTVLELGIFRGGMPVVIRSVALAASEEDAAWGDEISAEIVRTLKFYRDSHRDDDVLPGVPISFVGGAASRALLTAEIAAATGHTVELSALRVPLPDDQAPRFATNVGLALKEVAA